MRLSALATHIPDHRISAAQIVAAAGGSPAEAKVFQRMFGMEHVSATRPGETLDGVFSDLVARLAAAHSGEAPDALIYVRGQPLQYGRGRSPMDRLRQELPFLASVTRCYEVDQYNCGGLFWALDLARTLLVSGLARAVLVLGGDSHIGVPLGDRYVPGCTLMGDAFCGMLVDLDPSGAQISPIVLRTHPEFAAGRGGTAQETGAFFAAHQRICGEALELTGFDWQGQGLLLPHNVNRLAWQDFCRAFSLDEARIRLSLLPDVGHCYVCDPFLLLAEALATPLAEAPTLLSVGMGGYVGACSLTPPPPSSPDFSSFPLTTHRSEATECMLKEHC